MKSGIKGLLTIALPALCILASCNEVEDVSGAGSGLEGTVELKVTAGPSGCTKVSGISRLDELENEVKTLQVLVFRDGFLEASGSSVGSTSVTVSCTIGPKSVYAVVNGPDCSGISGEADMRKLKFELGSYVDSATELAFAMFGSVENVSMDASSELVIPVERLVSRVRIDKVSLDFASEALAKQEFVLDSVYFINAAVEAVLDGVSQAPRVNKKAFDASCERLAFLTCEAVGRKITDGSSDATSRYFYAMPSPPGTLIVLSARIGGRRYYYPMSIGAMAANTSYRVSDISITRPGSDSPSKPITFNEMSFSVNVQPWEDVTLPTEQFQI